MHKEYEARLTEVLHPLGLSQLSLLYADDSFVHDTQVLVAATPTDVFIIHRGSSGYADTFITDLTLKCAPLPSDWAAPAHEGTPAAHANPTSHSACVHSGFLRAHTSIYGPLLDLLDTRFDVPPPPRPYSSTHATANGPMSTASAASDASSAAAAGATASATRYASVQVVHLPALRDGPQQEVVAEAGRRFISGQGSARREGMEEGVGHKEAGVEAGGGATLGMGRQAGRRLWVTGHSLGGAMATLTALGLKRQGYNVAGLYTFGSPRVGNAGFSRLFRDAGLWTRSYRFVNEDDAVPQVPLTVMGYAHVGQRWVCVGGKCEFVANEGCVHSGFIPGLCDINTADHSLSTGYLPALRQSLPQSVPQCAIDKLPTGDVQ
ncbi:Alpha/Beta hydrolase protein [Haematococcus lacustris]